MKRLWIVLLVFSILGFSACDLLGNSSKKSVSGTRQIARLDLAGASALAVARTGAFSESSVTRVSTQSASILLKIDFAENFIPVQYYDEFGNPMSAPNAVEARMIDDEWIALFYEDVSRGEFPTEANHIYLVQKSTGTAFRIPQGFRALRTTNGFSVVAGGQLFVLLYERQEGTGLSLSRRLYRVTVGAIPEAVQVSLSVDTNVGDVYNGWNFHPSFAVGNDGTAIYNTIATSGDSRTRVVFPNGQGFTLKTESSLFWTAPDGFVYWLDWPGYGTSSPYPYEYRVSKPFTSSGSMIVENDVKATFFSDHFLHPSGTQIIVLDEQVLARSVGYFFQLYTDDTEVDLKQSQIERLNTSHPSMAWVGNKILFLIDDELIPFNTEPHAFEAEDAINVTPGYEIYEIFPYSGTEIFFTGMQINGGVKVNGRINIETGAVTITDTDAATYTVIQLERID